MVSFDISELIDDEQNFDRSFFLFIIFILLIRVFERFMTTYIYCNATKLFMLEKSIK